MSTKKDSKAHAAQNSVRHVRGLPAVDDAADRLFNVFDRRVWERYLPGWIFGRRKRLAIVVTGVESRASDWRPWLESLECFVMALDEDNLLEDWLGRWVVNTIDMVACVVVDADLIERAPVKDLITRIKSLDKEIPVLSLDCSDRIVGVEFDPALAWPADAILSTRCGLVGFRLGVLSAIDYQTRAT